MSFIKKYKVEIIIVLLFVISRLPSLGSDVFNTDVWKWKSRSYDFSTGVFTLDFEKTIQKYHPGVSLMWVGTISIKVFNLYHDLFLNTTPLDNDINTIFQLHAVQKFLLVLTISFVLAFIYSGLNKIFWRKYALLVVFLIAVEPFYIGLTRVFHLEGLMSTLMIASFVWFYVYLKESNKKHLALSAIFGGFSFLTKTSSLFLIPFMFLILILDSFFSDKRIKRSSLKVYFIWLLITFITFFVFWPALYTHFSQVMTTLYRGIFTIGIERPHPQLFLNKWVEDPGLLFYLVVILYRVSPLILLGFFGFFFVKNYFQNNDVSKFSLYALLLAVFYTIELTIPSKKLDRYILPTILSLILISSFFFDTLIYRLMEKVKNKLLVNSTILGFLLISGLSAIYIHPNYLSYYSPIMGGLKKGIYSIEPKWMIGQDEIVKYFSNVSDFELFEKGQTFDSLVNTKELENKLTIGFQEKYYTQIWPFIEKLGGRATIKDITAQAKQTNFFVYPVYDDDSAKEDRFKIEYIETIKLRGVDMYNVYKRVQ